MNEVICQSCCVEKFTVKLSAVSVGHALQALYGLYSGFKLLGFHFEADVLNGKVGSWEQERLRLGIEYTYEVMLSSCYLLYTKFYDSSNMTFHASKHKTLYIKVSYEEINL